MREATFAMIKSKAIRHNLHGHVLARILEKGFTIEHAKWQNLEPTLIAAFYRDHFGKPYWSDLERSVTGHVIVLALSAENAIAKWRDLIGPTDPNKASPDQLRSLATGETVIAHNIAHGSGSAKSAEREIRLILGPLVWFAIERRMNGN